MTSAKAEEILKTLKSQAKPENLAGMARYGINTTNTLGISIYVLREMAKRLGTDHPLALELWESGIHEARILASYLDDPTQVTESQMERWVSDFDSWDTCDQVCSSLFDRTQFAIQKAQEWSSREQVFVKRAGFVLMAALAVHNKQLPDAQFEQFLTLIAHHADDERNYVKKAVNWALRQIGKRNLSLNQKAIQIAELLLQRDSRAARWIASDALRELKSDKVQNKLKP